MSFLDGLFEFFDSIGVGSDDASSEIDKLKHNGASKDEARGHIKSQYGKDPKDYL